MSKTDKFIVITFVYMAIAWLAAFLVYVGVIPNANTGDTIAFTYAFVLSFVSWLNFVWLAAVSYFKW